MVASEWRDILYPGEETGWLTLNFFPGKETQWFRVNETPKYFSIRQNCFMGVGVRRENLGKLKRGEESDVIAIPGLWLDLDFASEEGAHKAKSLPPDVKACNHLLDAAPYEPTLVVHSGHGLQAYWLFNDPWYFSDDNERKRAKALNEGWQHWFQKEAGRHGWNVDSTPDLARVLRIPGTYNCKTKNQILVTIIQYSKKRYEPSDFDDFIEGQDQSPKDSPPRSSYAERGGDVLKDKNLSERIRYLILHGDTLAKYQSRSEAVFATINALARAGYQDEETIAVLMDSQYAISELPIEKGQKWVWQELGRAKGKSYSQIGSNNIRFREMFDQSSYSEITAGKQLIEEHGDNLHFIHRWNSWITYQNGIWEPDESGILAQYGKDVIAKIGHEAKQWLSGLLEIGQDEIIGMKAKQIDDIAHDIAAKQGEEKYKSAIVEISKARNLYNHSLKITGKLSDIVEASRTEPGIHLPIDRLDQHPFKLVCKNGVIDLETGELMPFSRGLLITKAIDIEYDPNASAPRWEQFLFELMGYPIGNDNPDMSTIELEKRDVSEATSKDLVDYLQRAIGYSLTGSVRDQVMFVLHGSGANGKSLFVSTLMRLFGKLSKKATQRLLLHKRNDNDHPTEIADLFGKRFVAAVETAEDQRLDEVFIKEATGDDVITARHMKENFWEFRPTHKLWLATNHKPQIRDISYAMWRRLHLIPFNITFQMPDRKEFDPSRPIADLTLSETLTRELQGILAWAVKGSMLWAEHGLKPPRIVQDATDEYRKEQDVFGQFIEECCIVEASSGSSFITLWEEFKRWADNSNRYAGTKNAFGRKLNDRGFEKEMSHGQRRYKGIRLRPKDDHG